MSLFDLPVVANPTSPRTPAMLFWVSSQQSYYQLVWRKKTNSFSFTNQAGLSTMPDVLGQAVFNARTQDGIGFQFAYWSPLPFRGSCTFLRRQLFRARVYLSTLLNERATARHGALCPPHEYPSVCLQGLIIQDAGMYTRRRAMYRNMGPTIRAKLAAYAEAGDHGDSAYADEGEIIGELVAHAEGYGIDRVQRTFVAAVNEAWNNAHGEVPLVVASCGHVARDDSTTLDFRGNAHCEDCAEELRYIGGAYYTDEDCYLWGSDGEYHTREEPESEDDDDDDDDDDDGDGDDGDDGDDDNSTPLVQSWRASTSSLAHSRFDQTPHSDFTMGVELEVECEDSNAYKKATQDTFDQFNSGIESYAMLKTDGSLSSNGFEIVTAARRLTDHVEQFSDWVPHDSLRAWKPGNCGVHVHIDSRAFSALTLGKFLMFINSNSNKVFLKKIAGRHPSDGGAAQSYCAQIGQEILVDPSKALKGDNTSRFRMVNLCNLSGNEQKRLRTPCVSRDSKGLYSTVELRIFRASLKKERLLAQIEFAHACVLFCRVASYADLTGEAFQKWLAGTAGQYKHLAKWFGVTTVHVDTRKPAVVEEDEAVCA
jgi:hypothetical protein